MAATQSDPRFRWSSYLLGFALGGFFDGILLHQILQWHHLLSTINSDDVRFQVAADGYFHVVMYVIAAAGLWMLVTSRHISPHPDGQQQSDVLGSLVAWRLRSRSPDCGMADEAQIRQG